MIHWLRLLRRTFKVGLKSLWLHRLRSLLTALGIIFGVCSVIAMLAVGEGASFEAQEQIRQLGSNNIIIRSVKPSEEQKLNTQRSFVSDYGLTYLDLSRLRDTIPASRSTRRRASSGSGCSTRREAWRRRSLAWCPGIRKSATCAWRKAASFRNWKPPRR